MEMQFQFLIYTLLFLRMEAMEGVDLIGVGDELGLNQTLTSKNGVFKMGFWRPSGLGKYYLSIWYAAIPLDERAVIWTAHNPCAKHLCSLELCPNSGLVIHGTTWRSSANITGVNIAKLTGTGNLIVLGTNGSTIWESFEHPTNILVPGQKLKPGQKLHSWISRTDPGGGSYSIRVLKGQGMFLYYNTSPKYAIRTDGLPGDVYGELLENRRCNLLVAHGVDHRIVAFRDILNTADASAPARIHFDCLGDLKLEIWNNDSWFYSWNQTLIISPERKSPAPAPASSPVPLSAAPPPGKSKGASKHFLIPTIICIVGFCAVIIVLWSVRRKCRTRLKGLRNVGSAAPTRFDYKFLKMATNNFKEELGRGASAPFTKAFWKTTILLQ
ncbi:hypothetical protein SUGI_0756930 [Cryptomeria japonica]|uniref:S-locus-specific glycoprotein S14-like n=1 Tax=Cryptomeria japonica TaxID=3369 RepID=UPI002414A066|nr:S-locus-specific glycoprotein S14-like [Cryptomeria japonica]GLJ37312.1 hypothetical protein SUGI_0756930 [Cryptomeria japonica]